MVLRLSALFAALWAGAGARRRALPAVDSSMLFSRFASGSHDGWSKPSQWTRKDRRFVPRCAEMWETR